MSKKILLITGSPRKGGNTDTLAAVFMAGAAAAGNEARLFDAAAASLDGCHADFSCHEKGYCGLKDDGVTMHGHIRWADVLVLVSPVYWKSFTSQIKRAIDRFNPYCAPKGRAECHIQEAYLLSTASSEDGSIFNAVREEFSHFCGYLGFTAAGELLIPGISGAGYLEKNDGYLKKAAMMGYHV